MFTLARIAGDSSITTNQGCTPPSRRDRTSIYASRTSRTAKPSPTKQYAPIYSQVGTILDQAQCNSGDFAICYKLMVRKGGLEPPWIAPPDPKSGASANSATFAWCLRELKSTLDARRAEPRCSQFITMWICGCLRIEVKRRRAEGMPAGWVKAQTRRILTPSFSKGAMASSAAEELVMSMWSSLAWQMKAGETWPNLLGSATTMTCRACLTILR